MVRFLLVVVAAIALVPGASLAIPVNLYHSVSDDGVAPGPAENAGCSPATITPVCLAQGMHTINLWADPTSAANGGTFGIQDILIQASGGISVVDFRCDAGANCIAGIPGDPTTQVFFTGGDDVNGDFAPFELGTITLNVGPGAGVFQLLSGTALGGDFVGGSVDLPVVVAQAVPEPGTAALIGLGLLALAGRRARLA